jgi:uncharacterized phiE125 gp8 family phage protein
VEYELSVGPTGEPLTIEDVESHCQFGELPADQRATVKNWITAARQIVERRLKRQLMTATWFGYLDSFPEIIEIRDKLPVASITSIYYYDGNGTNTLLASTLYQTDYASQQAPCRIMPAYGCTWPSTRADTYKAIKITFVSGYGAATTVPATIKNAMLFLIASWCQVRESLITGTIVNENPYGFEMCLAADDWGWYG